VWITLVIFAWFVAGQYVPIAGAALLTLYLTWSPWHYSGLNPAEEPAGCNAV
jgi:hypothetical protein